MKNKSNANTQCKEAQTQVQFTQIKSGLDVHADSYRVVRQTAPQPAQEMSPAQFLKFAQRQLQLASEVHCCYEVGPFGYGLHRQLVAMGVRNIVVRPQDWDELHTRVKTDKTDALALVQRLDRYVQGNPRAFSVVRVPLRPRNRRGQRVGNGSNFNRHVRSTKPPLSFTTVSYEACGTDNHPIAQPSRPFQLHGSVVPRPGPFTAFHVDECTRWFHFGFLPAPIGRQHYDQIHSRSFLHACRRGRFTLHSPRSGP